MTTTVPVEFLDAIHDATSARADELITTSRAIHALAEIGFEEFEVVASAQWCDRAARLPGRAWCLGDADGVRGETRDERTARRIRLRVRRAPRPWTRMRTQPHRDLVCGSGSGSCGLTEQRRGRCSRDHRRRTGGGGWWRQDSALPRRAVRRLRRSAHLSPLGSHRVDAVRACVHTLGVDLPREGCARSGPSRPRDQCPGRVRPCVQRCVAVAAAAT